ncbi:methyltransferase-like protein 17, mitochondrial [Ornithodoros turicata]|uniref:methyltransferase-like protein 17, mitochondrial n=1 Tax=Ornithodoros turicata TaxID=34597 RepID=UPI0031398812
MGHVHRLLRSLGTAQAVGSVRLISRASNAVCLPPDLEEDLELSHIKHRHHPGIRRHGKVSLPPKLLEAATSVLERRDMRQLQEGATILRAQLWSRHLPVEAGAIRQKAAHFERQLLGDKLESMSQEERDLMEDSVKEAVLTKLRRETYRWKAFNYDDFGSYTYLVARLAADYATLHRIFNEIKLIDQTFVPKTLMDFGSGVGTVYWAAQDTWPQKLAEYFAVDTSVHMNDLARLLVQGGNPADGNALKHRGYFQRQFLPASDKLKFDLVVSAFSLMELPNMQQRLQTVANLWAKTSRTLVLVENGTLAGHDAVSQARDFILTMENQHHTEEGKHAPCAHVLAPCPHDQECPKNLEDKKLPCTFAVEFHDPIFDPRKNMGHALYSYTVIQKSSSVLDARSWPRIIEPVLCRSKHVICRLCCKDGSLKEIVLTKKQNGRHAYRVARCSDWGDQLPLELLPGGDSHMEDS